MCHLFSLNEFGWMCVRCSMYFSACVCRSLVSYMNHNSIHHEVEVAICVCLNVFVGSRCVCVCVFEFFNILSSKGTIIIFLFHLFMYLDVNVLFYVPFLVYVMDFFVSSRVSIRLRVCVWVCVSWFWNRI